MYRTKVSFLLATSITLINTKSFTRRLSNHAVRSTKSFHGYLSNFSSFPKSKFLYLQSRNFTTIYNSQNLKKTFVFQPAQKNENPSSSSEIFPTLPDSSSDTSQDKKPSLVILFGWWNCQPKTLHKYVSLYVDKLHIDTLSHIPRFHHVFFPWTILKNIHLLAKELIHDWVERGKPDNIGFHVFSNNGTYHYAMLCEKIRQIANDPSISSEISSDEANSFLNSIKSCVIDSAPSPIFERTIALGIIGGFFPKNQNNLLKAKIMPDDPHHIEPHPFLISCLSLFFYLPFVKKYQAFAHKALDDIPGGTFDGRNIKYLFLYGPGDKIVHENDITKFMRKLISRKGDFNEKGVLKVIGKRFERNSEHVQHYMKYPEEYTDALKSFYGLR
ncbi:2093_t:CDS:1 [Acaulospora morrowiae]|uniref:2093_t:CDS:1 n=1 Tax=Acaulospora morrowiae TaxID=94023 RepID=A0A9N8ZTH2_9GLOM|nr:2093_t:CDS:1 [Acaulospora morrowiae]